MFFRYNYCNPRKNIPFERYLFNSRQQEPGKSFDRYVTSLRQIADKCDFGAITPDDLLRDRIIFGIADNKVRERLLREPELNLSKTLDICRASEMSQAQIKTVSVTAIGFRTESEPSMNHDESTNMATLMMVQYVKTETKDTITN